ncbi:MAG: choice-of-anchor J domain-containing protein [Lentimicrobium sp.]
MKKQLFFATILLILAVVANAQQKATYWSEDFEGNWSANWTISAGTWEAGAPTSGPNAAHGGTQCAATILDGIYTEGVDSRLISPEITIPAAIENPRLRFWQWFSFAANDFGLVQIKTTSGTTWDDISSLYVNTGSGIWTCPSIDLSAYAGQEVQICFYFHSSTDYYGGTYVSTGWYIDDISIVTGPVTFNNPETWESGPGDWSVDAGTWEAGPPESGPATAHGGANCAGTVLAGNYEEGVDSRLISPVFTVPASNLNPRLRFWQWFSFAANDFGMVQIKATSGTTWDDISGLYVNTGSGIWTNPTIDLSDYAGQEVQICFYFHSSTDYYGGTYVSTGWYIDDISIVTGPVTFNNPETWESGLGDWSVDAGTWEAGPPESGPATAHGGANCAGTVLAGNYEEGVDSRLISPVFTVPASNLNPRLRFWQWFSFAANDFGMVQIKATSGTTWDDISGLYVNTGSGIWTNPTIDLSDYAGQEVQICFYFHSSTDYYGGTYVSTGWYIDDISIATGPVTFNNPETWESGLGDWSVDAGTWEAGPPESGPATAHGGANCAGTVLAGNYEEGVDSRLISPVFTVPASNLNPRLRFWQWFSFAANDFGMVQIKATSGTTWDDISGLYVNTGSGIWTNPTIDLSDYAGQEVQICFYFHSSTDYYGGTYVSTGWYIDNISIVTGPVTFNNPETWESGPGDWCVDAGTWEVGVPESGPLAAHGGTNCAGTALAGNYEEGVDSRLISPVFTVPASNLNPGLRVWHWHDFASDDFGKVQIKISGNPEWIDLSDTMQNQNSLCDIWTNEILDLSAYAGQNVQFCFYFHSSTSYYGGTYVSSGWYIDDISITDVSTTTKALNINSVYLEGLYLGNGLMRKVQDENGDIFPGNTADQITIELHTAGCYVEKVYTIENVNLSTSGIASAALYGVLDGNYYITIKHRNSIETTSAAPVSFAGNDISYNFAISASQAYGSNQKDLNGDGSLWGLYSGDVSSISGEQDGYVDLFDLINVYNLNIVSASGYQPSDLTGDGYVDFIDLIIVYNNNVNSVGIITP